jgi:hypothetical protein
LAATIACGLLEPHRGIAAAIATHAVKTGTTWAIDSFTIGASPEMRKLLGLQG